MKNFMLIFIGTNYSDENLSPEEIQKRAGGWIAWQEKMGKDGVLREGNALKPQIKHINGSDRTVSDRTSTELKEIIGGYYIVEAKDFDDAIEIAQGYPDYDLGGTVEVREVLHY